MFPLLATSANPFMMAPPFPPAYAPPIGAFAGQCPQPYDSAPMYRRRRHHQHGAFGRGIMPMNLLPMHVTAGVRIGGAALPILGAFIGGVVFGLPGAVVGGIGGYLLSRA